MLTKICYTHTNKNDPSFAHSSRMDTQFETITGSLPYILHRCSSFSLHKEQE